MGCGLRRGEAYTRRWLASMRGAGYSDRVQRLVVVMPAVAGFLFFRYAGIHKSVVIDHVFALGKEQGLGRRRPTGVGRILAC
jgi:hypothetical protein